MKVTEYYYRAKNNLKYMDYIAFAFKKLAEDPKINKYVIIIGEKEYPVTRGTSITSVMEEWLKIRIDYQNNNDESPLSFKSDDAKFLFYSKLLMRNDLHFSCFTFNLANNIQEWINAHGIISKDTYYEYEKYWITYNHFNGVTYSVLLARELLKETMEWSEKIDF